MNDDAKQAPDAATEDADAVAQQLLATFVVRAIGVRRIYTMGGEKVYALNGVDFKKGCYVGQEVTARMKHKTELRKGLVRVDVDGEAPGTLPATFEMRAGAILLRG